MISFVPSWSKVSSGNISTDDLIGPIQAFQSSKEPYRIIIRDYLPNLRYFLHRFGLLESEYVSLFDRLQGFEGREQIHLKIEDLNFSKSVNYVYTPFSVLVFQNEQQIGEIIMAEGSHISEVRHFENQKVISIEIYDDRGFLSSRKVFEEGKHFLTEYIDSSERCIFTHFQKDGSCAVNYDNTRGLLRRYYESLEALIFECLEVELQQSATTEIILAVDEKNMAYASQSIFLEKMVLSYFSNRIALEESSQYIHHLLGSKAQALLVDSDSLLHSLTSLLSEREKIYKISPFDTRFMLSASQEMKDEVFYIDMRRTVYSESQIILEQIFNFMCERINQEVKRVFKIYIRAEANEAQNIEAYYFELISKRFPDEIALIDEYSLDETSENELEDSFMGDLKVRVNAVKELQQCLKIEVFESDDRLFKLLHETRLILDLSHSPDLFTQIAGLSSAIPQINRVATDYVQNNENGRILSSLDELSDALSYYLDSLKYWQEARTYSVQKIKQYSGRVLAQKLLYFFRENINE